MTALTFHHTGLLVDNLEEAIGHYTLVFGPKNISAIFDISSQKVRVCFVNVTPGVYLELVEPGPDAPMASLLRRKAGYYHVAYKVNNIHQTVEELEKINYKTLQYFNSEAFNGRLCIFLFTPEGHLVELIEHNA